MLINSAIGTFCCSILLWSVPRRMTSYNALICKELGKLSGHVLPTLIFLQSLYFASKVVLSISFEPFECLECATLVLHVNSQFEASMIISEDNMMLPALSGENLVLLQIRVD